jgi:hypothetical protein
MIFEPGLLTAAIAPQQTRKRYICIHKGSPGLENCLIPVLSSLIQGGYHTGNPFDTCPDWLGTEAQIRTNSESII